MRSALGTATPRAHQAVSHPGCAAKASSPLHCAWPLFVCQDLRPKPQVPDPPAQRCQARDAHKGKSEPALLLAVPRCADDGRRPQNCRRAGATAKELIIPACGPRLAVWFRSLTRTTTARNLKWPRRRKKRIGALCFCARAHVRWVGARGLATDMGARLAQGK